MDRMRREEEEEEQQGQQQDMKEPQEEQGGRGRTPRKFTDPTVQTTTYHMKKLIQVKRWILSPPRMPLAISSHRVDIWYHTDPHDQ